MNVSKNARIERASSLPRCLDLHTYFSFACGKSAVELFRLVLMCQPFSLKLSAFSLHESNLLNLRMFRSCQRSTMIHDEAKLE